MNEEREMNIHHYNTINNILNKDINESRTNNYADNNLSYDELRYTKKNPINTINNNLSQTDNNINSYENKGNILNKKDNIKQNRYYQAKNKYINKRINNFHNFIRPKYHSTSKISRSYRNTPERKIRNKFYENMNKDNNNNTDISNISIKANQVINEFKKTLLEAEKMENELNKSKNSMKTYTGFGANGNYIINNNNTSILNQTNKDNISSNSLLNNNNNNSKSNYVNDNNINDINEDEFLNEDSDELEKLKMKNDMLLKSNMALKNKNKILSHEINTYKNSSIYKNPFTQYDKDLNVFIQDLKASLDNAAQMNEELETIINNTQEENKQLKEKNQELLNNFELVKNECEKMTRENSELKVELENKIEDMINKDKNLNKYEKEINDLNDILNNNKNQIDYLNNIQESNKISQKDNEDLILELKNTIENLQKINLDNNNEIIELKNKIEEYKTTLSTKQNEISNLNDTVIEKEILIKNKDNQLNEYTDAINEVKKKNAENKNEIQTFIIENEKLKNDLKTTKMLLADRERTITSQKNSISFLTKTFNKNINMLNNNINNAIHNEENENYDMNKGLKAIIEKLQKEIVELNKKNNEKEKERLKIEKDLNEYHEQYEQIKYDYQLLFQKYKEQNKIIETIKKEFIKRNNDNELQRLTKANFEILAKLKQSQNENIIKTQQLEQLKKNYDLINKQFIEFTNNNFNSNSNNFSDINNTGNVLLSYNIDKSKNESINHENKNDLDMKQKDFLNNIKVGESNEDNFYQYSNENTIKFKSNFIDRNNNNDIIITDDMNNNIKEDDDIIYGNIKNNIKNNINNDNKFNIEINDNDNDMNINKESSDNLLNYSSKQNLNNDKQIMITNISNSDRLDNINNINIDNNDNGSEEIRDELSQVDNDNFSSLPNKMNYSSSQLQNSGLEMMNNCENPTTSNNHKSKIHSSDNIINNNLLMKELEMNDNISNDNSNNNTNNIKKVEKNQSLIPYTNIYTLKDNKIISFNLLEKKFMLINPKDNTKGAFDNLISKMSSPPLTLNTPEGFFILLDNYIFHYNKIDNTVNELTELLSSHIDGGFIYINNEIYSLSGKDCLQCEKFTNGKNIKLPSVNFPRINSGLCNINNDYLYVFFGNKCDNSIERLNLSIDYESMKEYINNWEYMQINSIEEIGEKISLERFTVFLDDFNNVIILGGNDSKGNVNQDIIGLNLADNEISVIGKIDTCALYIGQNVQLDDSIFAIYDSRNGLHFFNKELDYHEIYNFNI